MRVFANETTCRPDKQDDQEAKPGDNVEQQIHRFSQNNRTVLPMVIEHHIIHSPTIDLSRWL